LEQWKAEHPASFVEALTTGIMAPLASTDAAYLHTRLVMTTHLHRLRGAFAQAAAGGPARYEARPAAANRHLAGVPSLNRRFDLLDSFGEATLQLSTEVLGALAEHGEETKRTVPEELRVTHAQAESVYLEIEKDGRLPSSEASRMLRQRIGDLTNGLGDRLRFDDRIRGLIGEVESAGREVVQTYVEGSRIFFQPDSLGRVAGGLRDRAEKALEAVRDGLRADHYEPAAADRALSHLVTEFNLLLKALPDRLEEEEELTALVGEAGSRFAGLLRPDEPNAERVAANLGGRFREEWVRVHREVFDREPLDVSAWLADELEGADRFHRRVIDRHPTAQAQVPADTVGGIVQRADRPVEAVPEYELHELLGEGWIERNLKAPVEPLTNAELKLAAKQLAEVIDLRVDGDGGPTGVIRLKLNAELQANRPSTTIAIVQQSMQELQSARRILLDTGFGDPVDICLTE
jgi:hypothetical protein